MIRILLILTLCAVVPLAAGCYRKEVRRKSYPGFSVDTGGAQPAPVAEAPNLPDLPSQKGPGIGEILAAPFIFVGEAIGGLFKGIGSLFSGGDEPDQPPPDGQGKPATPTHQTPQEPAGDPAVPGANSNARPAP